MVEFSIGAGIILFLTAPFLFAVGMFLIALFLRNTIQNSGSRSVPRSQTPQHFPIKHDYGAPNLPGNSMHDPNDAHWAAHNAAMAQHQAAQDTALRLAMEQAALAPQAAQQAAPQATQDAMMHSHHQHHYQHQHVHHQPPMDCTPSPTVHHSAPVDMGHTHHHP